MPIPLANVRGELPGSALSLRITVATLWFDFNVKPLIDRSVATVKADAAYKAFSA